MKLNKIITKLDEISENVTDLNDTIMQQKKVIENAVYCLEAKKNKRTVDLMEAINENTLMLVEMNNTLTSVIDDLQKIVETIGEERSLEISINRDNKAYDPDFFKPADEFAFACLNGIDGNDGENEDDEDDEDNDEESKLGCNFDTNIYGDFDDRDNY
jgi:hypothetical protein